MVGTFPEAAMAEGTMADGSRPGNGRLGSQFRRQNLSDENALCSSRRDLDELLQFVQVIVSWT